MRVHRTATPSRRLPNALSRTWLVRTYGASISSVRWGSSSAQTGLPESRHRLRSPARRLDEHLQLTRLHVAGVVLDGDLDAGIHDAGARVLQHLDRRSSMCELDTAFAIGAGAEKARTIGERTSLAESTIFASCSSAVPAPCRTSRTSGRWSACRVRDRVRASRRARAPSSGGRARGPEETNLAEVDDLDLPFRGEVDLLKRRPVLLAEAVHVDAESHWCRWLLRFSEARGASCQWRAEGQGGSSESFHERPSICRHVVLCWLGDTRERTDGLFEPIVVVLLRRVSARPWASGSLDVDLSGPHSTF